MTYRTSSRQYWVLGTPDPDGDMGWSLNGNSFSGPFEYESKEEAESALESFRRYDAKERAEWVAISGSRFPKLLAWWRGVDLEYGPVPVPTYILRMNETITIEEAKA